jgi:hypothetical protein
MDALVRVTSCDFVDRFTDSIVAQGRVHNLSKTGRVFRPVAREIAKA